MHDTAKEVKRKKEHTTKMEKERKKQYRARITPDKTGLRPAARMRHTCVILLYLLGLQLHTSCVLGWVGDQGKLWLWSPTALFPVELINLETVWLEKWKVAQARGQHKVRWNPRTVSNLHLLDSLLARRGHSVERIRAILTEWWG